MNKMFKYLMAATAAAMIAAPAMAVTFETVNVDVTSDTRWTRDKVYILNRLIFVRNNATLTIEPGTLIRGITNVQSEITLEPGALIVAKDGKLVANGTADDPIIFTSIDDPHVPGGTATIPASFTNANSTVLTNGVEYGTISYSTTATGLLDNVFAHSQRWGGLIILGESYIANNTQSLVFPWGSGDLAISTTPAANGAAGSIGQEYMEGLDPVDLADTTRGGYSIYGGIDDTHNAGVVRFVSIRHGGFVIGAANEINSLTTGALGSDTVIEFVESTLNEDDGFEFFGGLHDTRFLFSHWIYDDSFDCDEGWRSNSQFWFAAQPNTTTQPQSGGNTVDEIFEFDGPEPNNAIPNELINVFNLTALAGSGKALEPDTAIKLNLANSLLQGGGTKAKTGSSPNEATIFTLNNVHHDGTISGTTGETGVVGSLAGQVVSASVYTTIDPRLGDNVSDDVDGGDPSNAIGVDGAGYAAFQRDNTFINGWTHAHALGKTPTSNIARPVLTLGVDGSNPTVTFAEAASTVAGRTVIYVVERTLDGKTWTPVSSVTDGGTADTNATNDVITVEDTATVLTSGVPVQYRAYAL